LFSFLWAWSLKKNLRLDREMRYGWMRVGDKIQEHLGIENDSRMPALWVKVIDHSYMPGYTVNTVKSVRSQWYAHWFTDGLCDQRGIYTLGPTSLETHDPLGIFTVRIDYSPGIVYDGCTGQPQQSIINPLSVFLTSLHPVTGGSC